ncbi:hypothetical protein JHV675_54450 [Mycobacterium avium subsp. hominissuis]
MDGGAKPQQPRGPRRVGDDVADVADPSRAARLLGFRAAVQPGDGLREFAFAPLR